jgi:hypothetical protein
MAISGILDAVGLLEASGYPLIAIAGILDAADLLEASCSFSEQRLLLLTILGASRPLGVEDPRVR